MIDAPLEPWEDEDRLRDFARQFVRTKNAVLAAQSARVANPQYRLAIWAERLLRRADVTGYVAEYADEAETRARLPTREVISEDFQEVFERALSDGAYAPAVAAKKAQAEVLGLMEKNVRVTVSRDVKELSMDDLEREIARLRQEGVLTLTAQSVDEDGVETFGADE